MIDKGTEIPRTPESEPDKNLKTLESLLNLAKSAEPGKVTKALDESIPR